MRHREPCEASVEGSRWASRNSRNNLPRSRIPGQVVRASVQVGSVDRALSNEAFQPAPRLLDLVRARLLGAEESSRGLPGRQPSEGLSDKLLQVDRMEDAARAGPVVMQDSERPELLGRLLQVREFD